MRSGTPLVLVAMLVACPSAAFDDARPGSFQALSQLGDSLFTPPLGDSVRAAREADLAVARQTWRRDTTDVMAIVWLGRRTACLGRYAVAVEVYTNGLASHPNEPHLLRHRGHRYLTLRRLDSAVADLSRAAEATRPRPSWHGGAQRPNAR